MSRAVCVYSINTREEARARLVCNNLWLLYVERIVIENRKFCGILHARKALVPIKGEPQFFMHNKRVFFMILISEV